MQAVVTELLYVRFPSLPAEAVRTVKKEITNDLSLATIGRRVGVNAVLLSSADFSKNQINSQASVKVIASATRSVVGAIHLQAGSQAARTFIRDLALGVLEKTDIHEFVLLAHPKQTLKHFLTSKKQPAPTCKILKESGRNTHFPTFVVGVFSGEKLLGEGAGWSIKNAEKEAVKTALMTHYGKELRNAPLPSEQDNYMPESEIVLLK